MAAEYDLGIRQIDPDGETHTARCIEEGDVCFLTMTIPLGGQQEQLDVGAIFSSGAVRMQFRAHGSYLSTSKQGRNFFYEHMDNSDYDEIKKRISLYFIDPSAEGDPVMPSLSVARPPNKLAAKLEIIIRSHSDK